jgi:hypothetical protein
MTPSPNNSQRKIDWRCGSNGRVNTLQVQSPEFKPQSHQKIKIEYDGNLILLSPK